MTRRGRFKTRLQHSPGVTLGLFWEPSSWAEEEEAASRRRSYQQAWGPEGEVSTCWIRHNTHGSHFTVRLILLLLL